MAGLSAALALMKSPVCARSRVGAGPGSAASRLLLGPRVCVGKHLGTQSSRCACGGVHEPRGGNVGSAPPARPRTVRLCASRQPAPAPASPGPGPPPATVFTLQWTPKG